MWKNSHRFPTREALIQLILTQVRSPSTAIKKVEGNWKFITWKIKKKCEVNFHITRNNVRKKKFPLQIENMIRKRDGIIDFEFCLLHLPTTHPHSRDASILSQTVIGDLCKNTIERMTMEEALNLNSLWDAASWIHK